MMARFYFDFHDADGVLRDDDGDLPDAIMARNVALESVGETVRDLTYRHDGARVAIEVRDGDGPVLRVSAVVETTSLKVTALAGFKAPFALLTMQNAEVL